MLALTRKVGEKIIIGGETVVEIVEIRGNKVRLGVTAPKHIIIDRTEVHEARIAGTSVR